jgi:hypothetical protein
MAGVEPVVAVFFSLANTAAVAYFPGFLGCRLEKRPEW